MKVTFILYFCLLTLVNCYSQDIKIGKAYSLKEVPFAIQEVQSQDPFPEHLKHDFKELPGHDDIVFDGSKNVAYASGMDGWIWKLDLERGTTSQWAKPPVNPAGLQFSNAKKEKLLVCASKLGGQTYEESNRVGLYELDLKTKSFQALVISLPKVENDDLEKVYPLKGAPTWQLKNLHSNQTRNFSLCNDIAVSQDGNRIFLTEPFERENAAMGSGAIPEAIGLYPHGKLWMYDRKKDTISLLLNGFTFIDGIVLEEGLQKDDIAVIFSETTKFRILKAYLSGEKQPSFKILFDSLPGLADGLERDQDGKIWVGIIKPRSGLINFVHRNPWTKPFLLSLPQGLLPIAKKTGILVLDRTGEKALYYTMHDGSLLKDISVVVPHGEFIYLPTFDLKAKGLFSLPKEALTMKEEK
ncbi:SMP-30/Gluconolaconase/LRE-like region [Leptospira ryugenii]|uniref:SMP-30/Gluconolaconase/LRE-like region n=1 Tax=Leptospira ryugenii TaxID=1917863 RepID=A0A2P2DZS2_9LEPT|nr:SMP-30/gluconolactonase/LRE family protein [Leptospira ryugenii]GBF50110.1 SMP-30/Gluconolaconase/LRE-like region [Leptospira ryugenii]